MIAFEKWWTELPIKEDAEDHSLETQAKYKKGWKAALRWLLLQPDGSCGVRRCIPMEALRDELGITGKKKRSTKNDTQD